VGYCRGYAYVSQWTQRIEESKALTQGRALLEQMPSLRERTTDPTLLEALDRIDTVIVLLIAALEDSDPRLVSQQILNNLSSYVGDLSSYINSWQQGNSTDYLTIHAQTSADNITHQLGQIPHTPWGGADKTIKGLRGSVLGHQQAVRRAMESLDEKVSDAKAVFDNKTNEAASAVVRLREMADETAVQYEKLDKDTKDLISQQQTAFSTAETKRSEAFNRLLTEESKKLGDSVDALSKNAAVKISDLQQETEEDRKAVIAAKTHVEEILGIVGDEALIGQYSKNAGDDKKTADVWRWMTFASIVAAIIAAGWLAWTVTSGEDINWHRIFAKALLTVSLGGLAAYAARQSSEHRHAQRQAEQMALQLAALKPYLRDIEDTAKRDQLLAEIALKLFGQSAETLTKKGKSNKKEDAATITLLEQAMTLVEEMAKRLK